MIGRRDGRKPNVARWALAGWMAAAGALTVSAAQREWCGGGADDNLSTAANWVGGVAPASGDILVFRGNVRTTPVNDYDPETTVFETLVFSNDCQTAERSAPFTLTGNRMVLTGGTTFVSPQGGGGYYAVFMADVKDGAELTDTLDLEISLPNNADNTSKIGGFATYRHHLLFRQSVTAPGGQLNMADQTRSNVTFEGPIAGFTRVFRPNGSGQVWLRSSENVFSEADPAHELREGALRVDSVAAAGGSGMSFSLGQDKYETAGRFYVNAQEDTLFTGRLLFLGPNYRVGAGQLYNVVAGTTATFTGDMEIITGQSATPPTNDGLGTGATFGGVGDGVFAGDILTPQTWVYKNDSGTWTLSGTSCATGAVTVSAGTLLVNGDYSTAERSVVRANARLGGVGRLGDVTFEMDSRLGATNVAERAALRVRKLTVPNVVKVDRLDAAVPAPGSYTILSFEARDGDGYFTLGTGWPVATTFTLEPTGLVVTIPSSVLTWTGAESSAWDFTTANWANGLFADGQVAAFGDAGERTEVTIGQEVRPVSVVVSGGKDYTFGGAGIAGGCVVEKEGSGTLVLANANTYTGETRVNGGALRLEGSLAGTTVRVGTGGAFTNAVTGHLTGRGALISSGMVELNGTNDFTGGLVLRGRTVITDPRAMGEGDVTLGGKTTTIKGTGEAVGLGRTLFTEYTDNGDHPIEVPSGTFQWLGDVRMRKFQLYLRASGTMIFGEPGCDTTVTATDLADGSSGMYLRDSGRMEFYSRIDLGNATLRKTDNCALHLHASGNRWSRLEIATGRAFCHANDTLARAGVKLGQVYGEHLFASFLDLGGFDQTITALEMDEKSLDGSSQTVKSEAPATLTISNEVDTTTLRMQCRIEGAVSLRKEGAGVWSFGAQNLTTGNVEVAEGTLRLTAGDTLPAGRESTLTIAPGAQLVLGEGVQAAIAYATCGGRRLKAGVYCGEGGTGTRLDGFIGAGGGSLTVTRGASGFMIIFR
ncbi:MAG: autotransporter-associated beta strand repeat-containing protein [Kiritimatiellia bacterium]